MWTDNPIADADRYYESIEEKLSGLPICELCGEHIQQDDAVCISTLEADIWYCDSCLEENRKETY